MGRVGVLGAARTKMTDPADSTGARPGSQWVVQGLAVIGALAFGGWILYANRAFYHDDAYITLR